MLATKIQYYNIVHCLRLAFKCGWYATVQCSNIQYVFWGDMRKITQKMLHMEFDSDHYTGIQTLYRYTYSIQIYRLYTDIQTLYRYTDCIQSYEGYSRCKLTSSGRQGETLTGNKWRATGTQFHQYYFALDAFLP